MGNKRLVSLLLVALLITAGSCKKAVENIKEDLMINLITSNTWKIVRYMEGSSNITSQFSDLDFDFKKDGTVNVSRNGVVEAVGTWEGSEPNQTVTSTFPPNSSELISKLAGVWKVTNTKSKPWRVFSERYENGTKLVLDMEAE